ncbi:2-dehydro-3-deoxy-6-phosphogalactonate aldolase [Tateyamaria pelophila]|uniref:2-dehydro-3-deoxy-6-phosphogalactonate aldolase n=1 Tax=Tateyamaria pelophila TaxID=328415 RepID=UPI001CBB8DE9|nr:2-dehydro-3-deoxy-6-phosphogalactonate aldolase [Tateyamaria pelophila]
MSREIIAILRGVTPAEAVEIATTLIETGIDRIEVPLNSPQPFDSIGKMLDAVGDRAQIGAGTVLDVPSVERLADMGAHMVVSPDTNASVIVATKQAGMLSYPGIMTPSECFAALQAGADGLKLFPASLLGIGGLKAIGAVLPKGTKTYAVGGVGPDDFADWRAAGVTGFGIGSALYAPGMSAQDVGARAAQMVAAYDGAK